MARRARLIVRRLASVGDEPDVAKPEHEPALTCCLEHRRAREANNREGPAHG